MARQRRAKRVQSAAGAALAGLGLVILFGKLDKPVARLTNCLSTGTRETLELLVALVPAAWHVLQAYSFDQQQLSPCPFRMLVSFWPLLHLIVGAL